MAKFTGPTFTGPTWDEDATLLQQVHRGARIAAWKARQAASRARRSWQGPGTQRACRTADSRHDQLQPAGDRGGPWGSAVEVDDSVLSTWQLRGDLIAIGATPSTFTAEGRSIGRQES
jgi:hypothetical protein